MSNVETLTAEDSLTKTSEEIRAILKNKDVNRVILSTWKVGGRGMNFDDVEAIFVVQENLPSSAMLEQGLRRSGRYGKPMYATCLVSSKRFGTFTLEELEERQELALSAQSLVVNASEFRFELFRPVQS